MTSKTVRSRSGTGEKKAVFQWAVIALFTLSVAFLGGSSRYDMAQLMALGPLVALLLIPALTAVSWSKLKDYRTIAGLLAALTIWMALQLIPLPPEAWQQLPGREAIAAIDSQLSVAPLWRPISLATDLGWSSLAGMIIPWAAILMAAAFKMRTQYLLYLIAALGVASIVLGFLQVAGGGDLFKLYRINSMGGPTGLFANENHSAAFLAMILLVLARQVIWAVKTRQSQAFIYGGAFLMGLSLLSILIHGSRAGIVMGLFASLVSMVMLWDGLSSGQGAPRSSRKKRGQRDWGRYAMGVFGLLFVGLIVIFLTMEKVPGFEGLSAQDSTSDLRLELVTPLTEMAKQFWLFGTGFGSFASVYMQFEPAALAGPSYVNQAHNDFLQLIIEGGLPAIVLFASLVLYVALLILQLARRFGLKSSLVLFWAAIVFILCAASAIDYPIRTPIFQLTVIWFLCVLVRDAKAAREGLGDYQR